MGWEALDMKKSLMFVMGAVLMFSLAACGSGKDNENQSGQQTTAQEESTEAIAGMPNPFYDYNSLKEAEEAAGFDLTVPDQIGDSDSCAYRVLQEENPMIEVIYYRNGQETARVRKQAGDENISGDYSQYSQIVSWDGTERSGNYYGNSEDHYVLAVWTSTEGYAYSLSLEEPCSQSEISSLQMSVK